MAGISRRPPGDEAISAAQAYISAALELSSPRRPAWRPGRALARLLPNPCASSEEFRRFRLEDVAELSQAAARHEATRLWIAVALVCEDVEDVMLWVHRRLRALDERARRAA